MLTPLIVGILFGVETLSGVLAGALVSGVQVGGSSSQISVSKFFLITFHHFQIAISACNIGGAWDNAKKYIEVNLHVDFTGPSFPCLNLHYTFSKKLFFKKKNAFYL
jgi:H+-translocating diphosphatase